LKIHAVGPSYIEKQIEIEIDQKDGRLKKSIQG
jgi:hypothetical protein